jgi:hypothetical protein
MILYKVKLIFYLLYLMHNYIVPNRYKFITRIGNWSEEWEQEEVK